MPPSGCGEPRARGPSVTRPRWIAGRFRAAGRSRSSRAWTRGSIQPAPGLEEGDAHGPEHVERARLRLRGGDRQAARGGVRAGPRPRPPRQTVTMGGVPQATHSLAIRRREFLAAAATGALTVAPIAERARGQGYESGRPRGARSCGVAARSQAVRRGACNRVPCPDRCPQRRPPHVRRRAAGCERMGPALSRGGAAPGASGGPAPCQAGPRARTGALRDLDRAEGPVRGARAAADGLQSRARRARRVTAQRRLEKVARRRDGPAGPHPHARVRPRCHHRPGGQSLAPRPHRGRVERGIGGGARREDGPSGDRHRHRRLAAPSRGSVRRQRDQAHARPRADGQRHPGGHQPRSCWAHGAYGRRLRGAAADHGARSRPAAPGHARAPRLAPAGRAQGGRDRPALAGCPSTPTWPMDSNRRAARSSAWAPGSHRGRPRPGRRWRTRTSGRSSVPSCGHTTAASQIAPTSIDPRSAKLVAAAAASQAERGFGLAKIACQRVTFAWLRWFGDHGVDLILEPTIPMVAPVRRGYDLGSPRDVRGHPLHQPLELHRLPGRLLPGGPRQPKRAAGERLPDRPTLR